MPIFYVSFFKAPKTVGDIIIKIQRDFLCCSEDGKRKICWESWNNICKPKNKGGLRIKNIYNFNASLLGKWRWELMVKKKSL